MNLIDVEYFTETETCLDKRMMMAQNMTHCTKCPDTIPGCSGWGRCYIWQQWHHPPLTCAGHVWRCTNTCRRNILGISSCRKQLITCSFKIQEPQEQLSTKRRCLLWLLSNMVSMSATAAAPLQTHTALVLNEWMFCGGQQQQQRAARWWHGGYF